MRRRLLALALLAPVLGGCATKRDLRDLREEVSAMRSAQEALLREIQQQNAAILDTLDLQEIRLRGEMTNQMVRIERQLVQIQELTGQGQQQLVQLRESVRAREEALRNQGLPEGAAPAPASGSPEDLFGTADAALQRGSLSTARAGFEEFVRRFPQHERASEAQLAVAETYRQGGNADRALEGYARVVELFPNSPQAATALYRSALLEVERGNRERARTLLTQVSTAYPRSPEAAQAKEQLQKLRR